MKRKIPQRMCIVCGEMKPKRELIRIVKNKEGDITSIYRTIDELAKLNPDFISVTYGAGGSTKGKTVEIASKIKNDYGIEAVAHLTCISSTKKELLEICQQR